MDDIAEQIRNKILEWQRQNAARVSEQAKQIVLAAVSAISYDPHPGWRLPTEMTPWPSWTKVCSRFSKTPLENFLKFSMSWQKNRRMEKISMHSPCFMPHRASSIGFALSIRRVLIAKQDDSGGAALSDFAESVLHIGKRRT
jgi:hypothetical protein